MATVGGKFTIRRRCSGSPLNPASSHPEFARVPHDLLHALQVGRGEHPVPVLGHENQVHDEHAAPASANVLY